MTVMGKIDLNFVKIHLIYYQSDLRRIVRKTLNVKTPSPHPSFLYLLPLRGTGGHGVGAQVGSSLASSAIPLSSGVVLFFTFLISNSSCHTLGAKKGCGLLTLAGCHAPTKWLHQSLPLQDKGKENVRWKKNLMDSLI